MPFNHRFGANLKTTFFTKFASNFLLFHVFGMKMKISTRVWSAQYPIASQNIQHFCSELWMKSCKWKNQKDGKMCIQANLLILVYQGYRSTVVHEAVNLTADWKVHCSNPGKGKWIWELG